MSGVPSAFILVLLLVLVLPDGVAIVLDLVIVPWPLVLVDDLVMPAGFRMVVDRVVVTRPGFCVVWVVVLVELALLVAVAGGVAGTAGVAGVWAKAAELPIKLNDTRKLRRRFMIRMNKGGGKMDLLRS